MLILIAFAVAFVAVAAAVIAVAIVAGGDAFVPPHCRRCCLPAASVLLLLLLVRVRCNPPRAFHLVFASFVLYLVSVLSND